MLKFKSSAFWLVLFGVGLAIGLAFLLIACSTDSVKVPPPPETHVIPVTDNLHGVAITDNYRWLEDQQSPDTRAWIEAQNAYTDNILNQIPGRTELKDFLSRLVKVDSMGMPAAVGGRYFFFKRLASQDLPVLYVRRGLEGQDEVLLDPHSMSPDKTTTVGLMDISKDGMRLLYAVRKGGEDETEVRVMDVDSRRDLPDVLPRAVYFGTSLTLDKKGLY